MKIKKENIMNTDNGLYMRRTGLGTLIRQNDGASKRSGLINKFKLLFAIVFIVSCLAATTAEAQKQSISVQQVPGEPFHISLEQAPISGGGGVISFPLPQNKGLVIEFVSAQIMVNSDAGDVAAFAVMTTVGGVRVPHSMMLSEDRGPMGGFPRHYDVSQQVRLYADPGTNVELGILTDLGGAGLFHVRVSGYLFGK